MTADPADLRAMAEANVTPKAELRELSKKALVLRVQALERSYYLAHYQLSSLSSAAHRLQTSFRDIIDREQDGTRA